MRRWIKRDSKRRARSRHLRSLKDQRMPPSRGEELVFLFASLTSGRKRKKSRKREKIPLLDQFANHVHVTLGVWRRRIGTFSPPQRAGERNSIFSSSLTVISVRSDPLCLLTT